MKETCISSYVEPFSPKNKKVLLRERKSNTACRVASARYAALSGGGGGYPIWRGGTPARSWWWGGLPHPGEVTPARSWWWGVPHPRFGVSHPRVGEYPSQVLMVGGTLGTPRNAVPPPPSRPGWGTPSPTIQTWMGYPPPRNVNRQTPVKTVPSPVLRTRAIIIFIFLFVLHLNFPWLF